MPIKKHKNDKSIAVILNRQEHEQRGNRYDDVGYTAYSVIAHVFYDDHLTDTKKEAKLSMSFTHHDDREPQDIRIEQISNLSNYNGHVAWGHAGISRECLERHEEFHNTGTIGDNPLSTIGDIFRGMFEDLEAKRNEIIRGLENDGPGM